MTQEQQEQQEQQELYKLIKALRKRKQEEFDLRIKLENTQKAVQLVEEELNRKIWTPRSPIPPE